MSNSMIKIIILVGVLVIIIAAVTTLCITSIGLGPIKTLAIKDITKSKSNLEKANAALVAAGSTYSNKETELATTKTEYNAEKTKYEAISDQTISIIQDATKDEKYFIEYLWITLGTYAKSHSLSLTVIDPGSKASSDQSSTATNKTTTPGATTPTGTTEKAPLVETIEASSATTTTTPATTNSGATTQAATNPATTTKTPSATNNAGSTTTAKSNVVSIQLKGNYLNIADFVFEVENDKTLRFKLDNISMKTSGGTDITASFEVKNLVIIK